MQILFSSIERLSILLNDDEEAVIMSEDFEVLERISFEDYYMPTAEEFLNIVDRTAKKYFKIEEEDAPFKSVSLHLYTLFMKQFKESDFYKDYLKYDSEGQ